LAKLKFDLNVYRIRTHISRANLSLSLSLGLIGLICAVTVGNVKDAIDIDIDIDTTINMHINVTCAQ